jgi:hypothetical protein
MRYKSWHFPIFFDSLAWVQNMSMLMVEETSALSNNTLQGLILTVPTK